MDRGDQIIKTYSPVAEDIDEALCNMDTEIAALRAEVERLRQATGHRLEDARLSLARGIAEMERAHAELSLARAALSAQPAPEPRAPTRCELPHPVVAKDRREFEERHGEVK